MSAKRKPFLCAIRIHQFAWVGRPGDPSSYRKCRRCQKVRLALGTDAAHDFYRSGMDKKSQDPRTWGG